MYVVGAPYPLPQYSEVPFEPSQPALTPAQIADIQCKIVEAEQAYDALMRGQSVTQLRDQNGETYTFTAAKKDDLYTYIYQLKAKLPRGTTLASTPARPLSFIF